MILLRTWNENQSLIYIFRTTLEESLTVVSRLVKWGLHILMKNASCSLLQRKLVWIFGETSLETVVFIMDNVVLKRRPLKSRKKKYHVRRNKAQCGNFRIFLSLRFYVKSILANFGSQKLSVCGRFWDWLLCQILENSTNFHTVSKVVAVWSHLWRPRRRGSERMRSTT